MKETFKIHLKAFSNTSSHKRLCQTFLNVSLILFFFINNNLASVMACYQHENADELFKQLHMYPHIINNLSIINLTCNSYNMQQICALLHYLSHTRNTVLISTISILCKFLRKLTLFLKIYKQAKYYMQAIILPICKQKFLHFYIIKFKKKKSIVSTFDDLVARKKH